MVTLYLDLDGTLIDGRRRHYQAYAESVSGLGGAPLAPTTYWARRRRGTSSLALLGHFEDTYRQRFQVEWLARIESPVYLRLDTLIPGTRRALTALATQHDLSLVTLRRDRSSLLEQLSSLGLIDFFSAVHSRGNSLRGRSKASLIRLATPEVDGRSIVVGDSEEDVHAAREIGLACVCVVSGVRNRSYLEKLRPDWIIDSIAQLPPITSSPAIHERARTTG